MNRAEIILAEKCVRSNEVRKMKLRKRYSEKEKVNWQHISTLYFHYYL